MEIYLLDLSLRAVWHACAAESAIRDNWHRISDIYFIELDAP